MKSSVLILLAALVAAPLALALTAFLSGLRQGAQSHAWREEELGT